MYWIFFLYTLNLISFSRKYNAMYYFDRSLIHFDEMLKTDYIKINNVRFKLFRRNKFPLMKWLTLKNYICYKDIELNIYYIDDIKFLWEYYFVTSWWFYPAFYMVVSLCALPRISKWYSLLLENTEMTIVLLYTWLESVAIFFFWSLKDWHPIEILIFILNNM